MVEDIFAFETMPRKFPVTIDAKYPSPTFDVKSPFASKLFRSVATVLVASDGSGDYEDIQKAIDALPSAGGIVYIKEGTFLISTFLSITSDNITLAGAGRGTKLQMSGDTAAYILKTIGDYTVIKNIYFEGDDANNPSSAELIRIDADNCIVEGCWIENGNYGGLTLMDNRSGNIVSSNYIDSCDDRGIYCQSDATIITENVVLSSGNNGIELGVGTTGTVRGCIIANNFVKTTTGNGIQLGASDTGNIVSTIIMGNYVEGSSGDGIEIYDTDSDKTVVLGNTFYNNSGEDIDDNGANTQMLSSSPPVYPLQFKDTSGNVIFQLESNGTLKLKGDIQTNESL